MIASRVRQVVCFPPIDVKERHTSDTDIPLGWTICRGSWQVTEMEAIAMMKGTLKPRIDGDAHRTLYRCPKVCNILGFGGNVERRRCCICCRRDMIRQHVNCKFDCELRFDAMAPERQTL